MTLYQEAAAQMVLLELGIARVSDIIRWADEKIITADKPHPALIEISTCPEDAFHNVFSHLRTLRSEIDRFDALRYAARDIRQAIEDGRLKVESAATFTYSYLCGDYSKIPEDMQSLYSADDDFYLVFEGYGRRDAVVQGFIGALKNIERA